MKIEDLNAFREEVVKLYLEGHTLCYIARKYNIYESVVSFLVTSAGLSTKLGVISKCKEVPKSEKV